MARTDPRTNDTTESSRDALGQRSIYSFNVLSISILVAVIAGAVLIWSYELLPFQHTPAASLE